MANPPKDNNVGSMPLLLRFPSVGEGTGRNSISSLINSPLQIRHALKKKKKQDASNLYPITMSKIRMLRMFPYWYTLNTLISIFSIWLYPCPLSPILTLMMSKLSSSGGFCIPKSWGISVKNLPTAFGINRHRMLEAWFGIDKYRWPGHWYCWFGFMGAPAARLYRAQTWALIIVQQKIISW